MSKFVKGSAIDAADRSLTVRLVVGTVYIDSGLGHRIQNRVMANAAEVRDLPVVSQPPPPASMHVSRRRGSGRPPCRWPAARWCCRAHCAFGASPDFQWSPHLHRTNVRRRWRDCSHRPAHSRLLSLMKPRGCARGRNLNDWRHSVSVLLLTRRPMGVVHVCNWKGCQAESTLTKAWQLFAAHHIDNSLSNNSRYSFHQFFSIRWTRWMRTVHAKNTPTTPHLKNRLSSLEKPISWKAYLMRLRNFERKFCTSVTISALAKPESFVLFW